MVRDERSDPRLLGVFRKRAVLAPTDADAWVRAAFLGPSGASNTTTRPARVDVTLKVAWAVETAGGIVANIVAEVAARPTGRAPTVRTYRGRALRTVYWGATAGVVQSATNAAFADLVRTVTTDLPWLCGSDTS